MTVVESAQRFAATREGRPPRRRRRWLLAAVAVVLLALLAWLVWWSPVLAVREVRVLGTRTVATEQVRAAADVPLGVPLARVSADEVAARVLTIGAVRTVEVRYGWPNVLVVAVTEREPVGVVTTSEGERLLDGEGVAYASAAGARAGLPEVRASGSAQQAAAAVLAGLPDPLAAQVRVVRAGTVDDVVLHLAGGTRVRWGGATDGARKAAVLTALLAREPRTVDVSAPDLPTTRGGHDPAEDGSADRSADGEPLDGTGGHRE